MEGLTDAERVKYLNLVYKFMRAKGARTMILGELESPPEMTEAEKAQYVEAFERFRRAHGGGPVDMDDAIRWSILRGDLPPVTPEAIKSFHTQRLQATVKSLLRNGRVSLSAVVGALVALTGHPPE